MDASLCDIGMTQRLASMISSVLRCGVKIVQSLKGKKGFLFFFSSLNSQFTSKKTIEALFRPS